MAPLPLPLWERIRRPNERSEFLAVVGEGFESVKSIHSGQVVPQTPNRQNPVLEDTGLVWEVFLWIQFRPLLAEERARPLGSQVMLQPQTRTRLT